MRIEVRAAGEFALFPLAVRMGSRRRRARSVPRKVKSNTTEPNTVALMLTGKAPTRGAVSIHVVDAATGVELKKLENVEVSIAI